MPFQGWSLLTRSEWPSITSVVTERFLLTIRSNSAKTIIAPTTATEAATSTKNTATINPLKIAIRVSLLERAALHYPSKLSRLLVGRLPRLSQKMIVAPWRALHDESRLLIGLW